MPTKPYQLWLSCSPFKSKWIKRIGVAGFLFFLLKGLLWLIVPGLLVYLGMN